MEAMAGVDLDDLRGRSGFKEASSDSRVESESESSSSKRVEDDDDGFVRRRNLVCFTSESSEIGSYGLTCGCDESEERDESDEGQEEESDVESEEDGDVSRQERVRRDDEDDDNELLWIVMLLGTSAERPDELS